MYPSFEPSAPGDEENPFAAPNRALHAWTLVILAAAGLFAGVLFGRVLLRTSMSGDGPFAPVPPVREAAPVRELEPVAPADAAPAATDARPAVQPPSAADSTAARKPTTKRSWHARASRDADEASSEALERTPNESAPAAPQRETTRSSESSEDEAAPQASAEPAAGGSLRINSRPWSQVFVDGRLVGNTPQLGVSVPAGRHTIRLFNPEFGMSKTFTVSVAPGESVTRIEMLED
jgi:serine/threonine-protein kinase